MARNAKAEMGLQKVKPSLQVASEDLRLLEIFRTHQNTILRLAAMQAIHLTRGRLAADLADVRSGASFDLRILHEEKVDPEAERARLEKDKQKLEATAHAGADATGQPGIPGARTEGNRARS